MDFYIPQTEVAMSQRKLEGYLKWAEIVQWGRKNPILFCNEFLGINFMDYQNWIFMNTWQSQFALWACCRNAGKMLSLDTKIPTPHGTTTMGQLKIGDIVFDKDGKPTKIIALSEIDLNPESYLVRFEDGEEIKACADHQWYVYVNNSNENHGAIATKQMLTHVGIDFYVPIVNSQKRKKIISIEKISPVPMRCIEVDNESHTYLCGEKNTVTHNSFLAAPYIMARTLLFPNHVTYIMAGSATQSQELFMKIEDTAYKKITSLTTLTDVFIHEVVKNDSRSTGFKHDQSFNSFKVFNHSKVISLPGNFDKQRGKRSNLNVYDESGFSADELFNSSMPFVLQDSNFKLGMDFVENNNKLAPINIPNQAILASSASSVETYFYRTYKQYAQEMMMGNKLYFVCDINCNIPLKPTVKGEPCTSLITQEQIDGEMKKNPTEAMREYYNIFTKDGGDSQPIKRAMVMRNCKQYLPIYYNDDKSEYIIAYDPARSYDNSIVLIGKLIFDKNVGYKLRLVNCIAFADLSKKNKTPMRTPEQIEHLKQLILDYNGQLAADYENIEKLVVDRGSGGGGKTIGDYLIEDWYDKSGTKHRGIMDKEDVEQEGYNPFDYPNAVEKLKLVEPTKYKKIMYDSMIEMIGLNLIEFPEDYSASDTYTYFDKSEDNEEYEEKILYLDDEQRLTYTQIELLKKELYEVWRYDGANGNYRYDKAPTDKTIGVIKTDDRAYCTAMLCWILGNKRRQNVLNPSRNNDLSDYIQQLASLWDI